MAGQVFALSWLLHQGNEIFPIPGTREIVRVDENLESLNIKLDDSTIKKINEIAMLDLAEGATLLP